MRHHFLLDKGPIQIASVSILQQHPGLAHVLASPVYLRPRCSLQDHASTVINKANNPKAGQPPTYTGCH